MSISVLSLQQHTTFSNKNNVPPTRELGGGDLSRPGKSQGQTRFFFPGEAGFPVVFLVVGDDLESAGSPEIKSGKDIGQEERDLGKCQADFFFENFRRIFCRKA